MLTLKKLQLGLLNQLFLFFKPFVFIINRRIYYFIFIMSAQGAPNICFTLPSTHHE